MFNLGAFLSYVFVVTFTPGPNNIMSMAFSSKYSFKKASRFDLGVFTGFFIIMILSSYFNLVLFNILPKIKVFMSILGASYMLYLAIKIMKSDNIKNKKDDEENEEIASDNSNLDSLKDDNNLSLFITGITMQFINPKAILYGITIVSTFIIPHFKSNITLILFSLFLAFVALVSTLCWALFGSLFNKFLLKYRKQFNIVMGLLLIYSAISISGIIHLM